MGATTKTKPIRKATFARSVEDGVAYYTPVNKRAKALTKKAVTRVQLLALKKKSKAAFYAWTTAGLRKVA